ncbi:MAG: hypothetical protein KKF41_05105 [Actinobacteria bacterium]|nr:hypothetical protein [Actinomycetota bacterium]MBU1943967.1 hypothetical protein [Actinomycetota bacterium]MBU2686945.1 hypothetical protein [Actinomycetota bacterium]
MAAGADRVYHGDGPGGSPWAVSATSRSRLFSWSWGDHALTRENYRALKRSGCVIQTESGEVEALPHRDAAREFSWMPEAHRSLYQ